MRLENTTSCPLHQHIHFFKYRRYAVPRSANDSLEQLPSCKHFHDDVQILLALVQPLHADDVGVIHKLENCGEMLSIDVFKRNQMCLQGDD